MGLIAQKINERKFEVMSRTTTAAPAVDERITALKADVDALIATPNEGMSKSNLRTKAETLAIYRNTATTMNAGDIVNRIDNAMPEVINLYTALAKRECYDELFATDDPLLAAVRKLSFPTIKDKKSRVGEDGEKIEIVEIQDIEKRINLYDLHKSAPDGVGADKKWIYMVERLNFYFVGHIAQQLGIKLTDLDGSYAMSKLAAEIDMGKTPLSKNNIGKTFQNVLNAMFGDTSGIKVSTKHINYILIVYAKEGKASLTVACRNKRKFADIVLQMCHAIVCDEPFKLDYPTKKVSA